MASNATEAASGLGLFFHSTLPSTWTSFIALLVSYLGEATAFVLLNFGTSYLITFYNNMYFKWIYENGYYEKYRIQNDRRLPKLLEDLAWEKTFGLTGLVGILLVGLPQQYLGYFVMNRVFGISVLSMPESYLQAAYQFVLGTFAWDTLLFFIHYGLHKIPWAYKNIHKKHHEVKTVSTVVAGHAYFIDLLLSPYPVFGIHLVNTNPLRLFQVDFVPTRFGMIAAHMSFPVLFVWNAFYSHIALRAHCGYKLPGDPVNWFMPYVENRTSLSLFFDRLLGG